MPERQRNPLRLLAIGLLAAYGIAFVVLNNDEIELNFIFFKQSASLIVALILIAALAFAVGFLAHMAYKRNGNRVD